MFPRISEFNSFFLSCFAFAVFLLENAFFSASSNETSAFQTRNFTALIKIRNYRPLSLVLASMHSYLFHKKRMFSFCPFSFVFVSLIIIVGCIVFAVFVLDITYFL